MPVIWKCHICGRERPDEYISIFTKDISADMHLPEGHAKHNIRYCNDNADCVMAAPEYSLFKKEK